MSMPAWHAVGSSHARLGSRSRRHPARPPTARRNLAGPRRRHRRARHRPHRRPRPGPEPDGDRVRADPWTSNGGKRLLLGAQFTGQQVTLRFGGRLLHVITGGLLVKTLTSPVELAQRSRLTGARVVTTRLPPPPSRLPRAVRKVPLDGVTSPDPSISDPPCRLHASHGASASPNARSPAGPWRCPAFCHPVRTSLRLQEHLAHSPPLSSQAPTSAYRVTPAYRRDHPSSPPEVKPQRSATPGQVP